MKKRESGLELLRIIMMLQVIFLHVVSKGNYLDVSDLFSHNHYLFNYFIWLLSRCPVYIFFILTGYFLVNKEMNIYSVINRIKKIYLPMLFFSIVLTLGGGFIGLWSFSDINIPKMLFPFLSCSWYFLTGYILLIILSPFLNKFIKSLNKKEYFIILVIMCLLLSIWPSLSNLSPFNSFISTFQNISNDGGKSLYDYIFMYLLGGFISLHMNKINRLEFKYLFAFVFIGGIQFVLVLLIPQYGSVAWYNDNIFAILQCICLMLFFKNLKFKSKIINYVSTYTLAVYIIHEHISLSNYIWGNVIVFHIEYFNSAFYPLKTVIICILIFMFCMVLEFIRRIIFKFVVIIGNFIKKKCDSECF